MRDLGRAEAAVAQPRMSYGDHELYPTVVEKAAALAYAIIQGHPFVDGNKRAGHAAMAVFLRLNGHDIAAAVDEQETLILGVASGAVSREALATWLRAHSKQTR